MNRRLRIGIISPRLMGSSFNSRAASYPPPSALTAKIPRHSPAISEIAAKKSESIKVIADIPQKKKKTSSAPLNRKATPSSAPLSVPFDPVSLGEVFQYSTFEVPEHFSGFGRAFKVLNSELCSIHSDPSVPVEIRLALDAGVSSFNKQLSSDATEVGKLKFSKQYLASLRVSDHYEERASEFLGGAKSRNLPRMIETAGKMGINLPNLLYKRGVYIKLGKRGATR